MNRDWDWRKTFEDEFGFRPDSEETGVSMDASSVRAGAGSGGVTSGARSLQKNTDRGEGSYAPRAVKAGGGCSGTQQKPPPADLMPSVHAPTFGGGMTASIRSRQDWTEARVELLKQLWMQGLTASEIVTQLGGGITRNAVIGKVTRLGLQKRNKGGRPRMAKPSMPSPIIGKPADRAPVQQDTAAGMIGVAASHTSKEELVHPGAADQCEPEPDAPVEAPRGGVHLLDLRATSCRWPLGDLWKPSDHFCGAHTGGVEHVYCAAHRLRAYAPRPEKARRGARAGA